MLSKNAIGNMINRYTAVLKKCRLINVFGSLALVGTLLCGSPAFAATPDVTVTTEVYTETNKDNYYTTYEVPVWDDENGVYTSTSYGVLIGLDEVDENYTDISDLLVDAVISTTSDVSSSEISSTYFNKIEQVTDTGSLTQGIDYTFSIKYEDTTYYFAVKDSSDTIITTPNNTRQTELSDNLTENFIGFFNTTSTNLPDLSIDAVYGGAIYNTSKNGYTITGDFIGNYASGNSYAYGGAIYNASYATIGDITGAFIGNYAYSSANAAYGGAIYNASYATIGDITGNFIGNYAYSSANAAYGGAIYTDRVTEIGDITGNFIGNYAQTDANSKAEGGAIYSASDDSYGGHGAIGDITGSFIGNYAYCSEGMAHGGAIYNYQDIAIGDITGSFIGNYAYGGVEAYGGAIYNLNGAEIGDIIGNFIGNYAYGEGKAYGGAIYNISSSKIGDITGSFIENYVTSTGDKASGGAIYNTATIGNITGDFIDNYASSTKSYVLGGAIYNSSGTIGAVTGNFIENYTSSTAIYANGGAIYNNGTIGIISGSFIGNYASGSTSALGGAIYTTTALSFVADGASYVFTNNYTNNSGTIDYNAIYTTGGTLTFDMSNGGSYVMNDSILGSSAYNVAIQGDSDTSTVENFYLNDEIDANGTVTVTNATLTLGSYVHNDDDVTATDETTYGSISGSLIINNDAALVINGVDFAATSGSSFTGDIYLLAGSFQINTDYANIANTFYWSGGSFNLDTGYDTITVDDGGKLIVTADITLSDNLTVAYGGSLSITSGTLNVSTTTLSVADGASLTIGADGALTASGTDFGTISTNSGDYFDTTNATVLGTISNSGTLTLVYSESTLAKTAYANLLLDDGYIALTNNGEVVLSGITLDGLYSLTDVISNAGLASENIMAGDLLDNTITFAGIVKNTDTDSTASTIAEGSSLTLTGGNDGYVLLDAGSLTNSGTLVLGSDSVDTASFNGTLETTDTGTTNVLSAVTFSKEVANDGTMSISDDVTFSDTVTNNGIMTLADTATFTTLNNYGSLSVVNSVNVGTATFGQDSTLTVNADTLLGDTALVGSTSITVETGATLAIESSGVIFESADESTVTIATASSLSVADNAWGYGGSDGSIDATTITVDSQLMEVTSINYVEDDSYSVTVTKLASADVYGDDLSSGLAGLIDGLDTTDPAYSFFANTTASGAQGAANASIAGGTMPVLNMAGSAGIANVYSHNTMTVAESPTSTYLAMNGDGIIVPSSKGLEMSKGFGVWAMPMYKHTSADGFSSDNFDYGFDANLYGMTLGMDYTFDSNVRFGAALHVGMGESESTGDYAKTENDFDYYGLSLYASKYFGALALTADLGVMASDNDIKQAGGITAEADALMLTAGIKAEYRFDFNDFALSPYAGLRINHYDVDAYDTKQYGVTLVHAHDSESTIVEIPVGLGIATTLESGDWTLTPHASLGVKFAAGDLDAEQKVSLGQNVETTVLSSEVADAVTFQGALGLGMKMDAYSIDFGYSLDLSENVQSHGVNLNLRYEF